MRKLLRSAALAVAAALVGAGVTAAAMDDHRVMTVILPDGSRTRIAYQGKLEPMVSVAPIGVTDTGSAAAALTPSIGIDPWESAIDHHMAEMVRQVDLLERNALLSGDSARFPDKVV